jgi:thymidylate synthase ThyX
MKNFDVFCLLDNDGKLLDPAVQSTVLAKYSRSPLSAREILSSLTSEEANKFQDKWVVKYGHNSVAELAAIPVCFEGISIVASKFIERWQRPGYSEKSTRYQKFSADSFVAPPGAPDYVSDFVKPLYDTYDRLYEQMCEICAEKMGKDPDHRTVKARAFDNLRYLLPAGTGTNVACVLNLRDARDMIVSLRSQDNPELQLLGNKMHDAVYEVAPTLTKHTEPTKFVLNISELDRSSDLKTPVHLHDNLLLRNSNRDIRVMREFKFRLEDWHGMDLKSFNEFMVTRPEHSEVPDIFKTIPLTYTLTMDYGAFRDLQRHRRCEQYVEPHTHRYGYDIPDDIKGSEIEEEYCIVMDYSRSLDYVKLFNDPSPKSIPQYKLYEQYVTPLGYRHRSTFQMDMKELYYIVELRTKPQGHISYRRIAYEMYRQALDVHPYLMQWCRAIKPNTIGEHK